VEISLKTWLESVLPRTATIIGEVSPGLPAYNAGLQAGDKVIAVNGKPVNDWYELRQAIQAADNEFVELEIERNQGRFTRRIQLQENLLDGSSVIGITQQLPVTVQETYNLWESIRYGTLSTLDLVALNYMGLYKLVLKPSELKNNIGGPVLMYTMSRETVKQGWNAILSFVAIISVILMVMNLLPIPVLDGGMILFCLIEGIRKKALSLKTQLTLQKIGASLLIILMFFAFSNDFSRLFKRSASISSQNTELEAKENN
jgi:regulator of sigma E protease